MSDRVPATAIVLAGGQSRRFGSDKTRALLGGRPLLEWVVASVAEVCEDVIVVGGPEPVPAPARYVPEEGTARGPLGGIVAGFRAARFDLCFVAACDAPLLLPAVVRMVLSALGEGDAALPLVDGVPQPLAAAYHRDRCLAPFEKLLARGSAGPSQAVRQVHRIDVAEARIREIDPELRSFMNANTPEALAEIAALVSRELA